jgi:hypothetical protein
MPDIAYFQNRTILALKKLIVDQINYYFSYNLYRVYLLQFLLRVSVAMTINKSRGQSLKNIGIKFPTSVFSHGQIYVAI